MNASGHTMIQVTIAGYLLSILEHMPEHDDSRCAHATLVDRFELQLGSMEADGVHIDVGRGFDWPFLCVVQRYWPGHWAGCRPGILLVPETHIRFVGAGERLLAYDLHGPARLWEDHADAGFHGWQCHDDLVLMSAELELAAWDIRGVKRWSTLQSSVFIEPPWEYHVESGVVHLDVMGTVSSFPLLAGPTRV
jgi:hypothetical protein